MVWNISLGAILEVLSKHAEYRNRGCTTKSCARNKGGRAGGRLRERLYGKTKGRQVSIWYVAPGGWGKRDWLMSLRLSPSLLSQNCEPRLSFGLPCLETSRGVGSRFA
jgi:hypothetical protein